MEKKTLNISVLEDLNYGILRIYAEFWKKISKSTRRLSEERDASIHIIHCHIKTLGKSCRRYKSIPHELTPQKAQRRVDICRQLIGNPLYDRFMRGIVTCDEKWVHYRIPDVLK